MPVKPPPATTTVSRAADAGRRARAWRWRSRVTASSSWSTAEHMLGNAGNVRAEQPAAGGEHQPVIGQRPALAATGDDPHRIRPGVDRLGGALHIADVDFLQHRQERRRQRLGLGLVEPRADHQRRLRRHQFDLEFLGRDALEIAQARGGKGGIHAGEAGADDDQSHVNYSCEGFRKGARRRCRAVGRGLAFGCDAQRSRRQPAMKASSSAVTRSAWVVQMPCGSFS